MRFHRLKDEGITEFRRYLEALRADPSLPIPSALLDDPNLTEPLPCEVAAAAPVFATRMDFARWLDQAFASAGTTAPLLDVGFWSWLTVFLFDQVCPSSTSGKRSVGADARYIPDTSRWNRRYRHLLANPFQVYQLHHDDPNRAAVVLLNPLHKPGELTEQFTSRLEIISCRGAIGLATKLFIDPTSGARKRGAAGTSASRFGKLMNQYVRTWDLSSVHLDRFMEMLPREFNRFKTRPSTDL